MARLDRTSGGSNTKKVILTYLATSYSVPTSSTQRFQRRICLQYAFIHFFSDKKKIGIKNQIYFIILGWGQCHNLNELKFTPLF